MINKTLLYELKEGDCFKLFEDSPIVWLVIDCKPQEYTNSFRCRSLNGCHSITAPFSINTFVCFSL